MLQGMRKASQGWLGRVVTTILFGMLIIAFGFWGISDIFRGYGRNTAAKVGNVEIGADAMRNAYQNEVQRYQRTFRQTITPERAKAFGIDTLVLNRMISEAALDQRARRLGLSVSDEKVREAIVEEPIFKGITGKFDRNRFNDLLRDNGYNEGTYVRDQRANMVRQQLLEALSGGLVPPLAVREAAFRLGAERRNVSYFTLPADSAGEIAAPDEAALKAFFDERRSSFRAPEYRKLSVLAVTPASLAKPGDVTDEAARARYEKDKTAKYGSPERRKLQQIRFANEAEAQAAAEKIKGGTSFDDIVKERNLAAKDIELGNLSRTEVADPAVRDAAFGLEQGGVSGVVAGRFGTAIVRVEAIEPEKVKPFEEVADQAKRDVAIERAKTEIGALHEKIEEQRSLAKPLTQIAPDLGLSVRTIEAVDRDGQDKTKKDVADIPEETALLTAAFASEISADNEAIRASDGGYVWFDVTGVEPSRDQNLDEVREEVVKAWRTEEINRRLAAKARGYVARLDKNEPFAAVAAEAGQEAKTTEGLARGQVKGDMTSETLSRIFSTPAGKAGTTALGEGDSRVVFLVTAATAPAFDPKNAEATRLDEQLRATMADDLRQELVKQLQADLGVTLNGQAIKNALGGTSADY